MADDWKSSRHEKEQASLMQTMTEEEEPLMRSEADGWKSSHHDFLTYLVIFIKVSFIITRLLPLAIRLAVDSDCQHRDIKSVYQTQPVTRRDWTRAVRTSNKFVALRK